MGLMDGDYPTPDARKQFYDRLLQQLRGDPEFAAVAYTNRIRMVFAGSTTIEIAGKSYQTDRDRPTASVEQVSAGFFDVTGQTMLEGRTFTDDDLDTRQPVAVVNQAFASKHFGRESALGRQFRTARPNGSGASPWRTIVGVVSNVRMLGPFNNPNVDDTGFYVPFYASAFGPAQAAPFVGQFTTVAVKPRPGQSVDALANVLRRAVNNADTNLPLYFVGTPKSQLDTFVAQNRIIATMFSIFGVVAIVLASVGIYGVMSFSVNQRTQEFGVRMALGATARRILGLVMRQGALQVAAGLVLGVGLAFGIATLLGNAIQNTLFGVSGRDPLTYGLVVAIVAVVSLIATLVDPNVALRAD